MSIIWIKTKVLKKTFLPISYLLSSFSLQGSRITSFQSLRCRAAFVPIVYFSWKHPPTYNQQTQKRVWYTRWTPTYPWNLQIKIPSSETPCQFLQSEKFSLKTLYFSPQYSMVYNCQVPWEIICLKTVPRSQAPWRVGSYPLCLPSSPSESLPEL